MKTLALLSVLILAGCGLYPTTPEGDAQREADARAVEAAGGSVATAAGLLPPPFNLIVAGVVGVGATIAAGKIRGKPPTPPQPPVA